MKFMDYFKATTIEETALEYQNKGYQVVMSPIDVTAPFETKAQKYDLVVTKGDYKVAIEVIARPKLAAEVRRIAELRRQAKKEGFDDFRLVVVDEPRQIPIKIEGIEQALSTYLAQNITPELAALSSGVRVHTVEIANVDEISIKIEGTRVVGQGLVIVDIFYDQDGEQFWEDDDFSLKFDVELDHKLKLKRVHNIVANTKHFWY